MISFIINVWSNVKMLEHRFVFDFVCWWICRTYINIWNTRAQTLLHYITLSIMFWQTYFELKLFLVCKNVSISLVFICCRIMCRSIFAACCTPACAASSAVKVHASLQCMLCLPLTPFIHFHSLCITNSWIIYYATNYDQQSIRRRNRLGQWLSLVVM